MSDPAAGRRDVHTDDYEKKHAGPRPVESTVELEVRYAETDQMAVVHHANYVVWFEVARTRLCERSGFHYADIEKLGYLLMVTGVHVSYRQPARYGDRVSLTCHIERMASRGVTFAYEVRNGEALLARGTTDHVWVDQGSGRPCRTPQALEAPFRRMAGLGEDNG
jgi:acyl-CoA thioester hydrolase